MRSGSGSGVDGVEAVGAADSEELSRVGAEVDAENAFAGLQTTDAGLREEERGSGAVKGNQVAGVSDTEDHFRLETAGEQGRGGESKDTESFHSFVLNEPPLAEYGEEGDSDQEGAIKRGHR